MCQRPIKGHRESTKLRDKDFHPYNYGRTKKKFTDKKNS